MPNDFVEKVLVGAAGTVVGGLVLVAIVAVLTRLLIGIASSDERRRKRIRRWLNFSLVALVALPVVLCAAILAAWQFGGVNLPDLWRQFQADGELTWVPGPDEQPWAVEMFVISVLLMLLGGFLLVCTLVLRASVAVLEWVADTWHQT